MLNHLHLLVPSTRVVMAGGCALNSVANGKIFFKTPFQETCIQPAAGDDGLALGAALHVAHSVLEEGENRAPKNVYYGGGYDDGEIQAALDSNKISYDKCDRDTLIRETVGEIKKGAVVGWFQGRSEWGPRALGNRSILCHPGLPDMKDVLNSRIKKRESFRPFAPTILKEELGNVFEHDYPSPFMLHVYGTREEWRERLTAVNHLDNTGRLQSVTEEQNPLYYSLIKEFHRETGIPVLLNTSFNENEPIVETYGEAIDCFLRTKMDVLVIGPFVCRKTES